MAELQFEVIEFDPYELDPSESPRWNLLARLWPQVQTALYSTAFESYELKDGREEFHLLPYVSRWLGTELVSPFLTRQVVTIQDYVEHCEKQALVWHNQDVASIKRVEGSAAFFETRAKLRKSKRETPEINAARLAWKAAIQERRDALVILDEKIRFLHDRFVQLRDGLETPVVKS